MTQCERLSDRLPSVAAGQPWSDVERRHLDSCPGCQAEWAIVAAGASLGAGLPSLAADRIALEVRTRLRAEPDPKVIPIATRRPAGGGRWGVALAAAAAVVLAVSLNRPQTDSPVPAAVATAGPMLSELDDLSASELERMLGDLEDGGVEDQLKGMGDLNSNELEQILQGWES